MKAVILAAGEGSRMRPLTYTRPKVMLPIANRPILEHLLLEVKQAGIEEFIFIVGYRSEQVREYFGHGEKWGVKIDYCDQRRQGGTADALRLVEGKVKGEFLALNGDILARHEDIRKLASQGGTVVSVIKVENTTDLGTLELKEDRVVRIHEKEQRSPSRMANAGIYLFTEKIFSTIAQTEKSPRGEYEITDSLQRLIDKGQTVSYLEIGYWLRLDYPWDLLSANEAMLASTQAQNQGEIEAGAVVKNGVVIGERTVVRSGSYIVGPSIIGRDCDIGPNCFIRPSTSIADGCHIGSGVEVKNCIVMRGSKIPHLNYVGDSVIGEQCNLGAGTKLANMRLDKKDIKIGNVNTRRRKLGAILGDHVEVGINVSINVGCLIGNNSFIGPGALAEGVILPDSKVF